MLNKLFVNCLLIAAVLLGQTNTAQAQISVQVDADGVICGLLPNELQSMCFEQPYFISKSRKMSNFCESLMFKENRSACQKMIRARYFNGGGLEFCFSLVLLSNKFDCLKSIADVRYFQPEALEACSTILFSENKLDCLNAYKNSYIHPEDIDSCRSKFKAGDKLQCLKQSSQKVEYPYVIPPPKKGWGIFSRR